MERDCFDEGEVHLPHLPNFYGYRYSMSNCWFEYVLRFVKEECQCEHWEYQVPLSKEHTDLPTCNKTSPQNISCVEKQFSRSQTDIYKQAGVNGKLKAGKCLPSCEDQKLGPVTVTSAPIAVTPDIYCLLAKRMVVRCRGIDYWDEPYSTEDDSVLSFCRHLRRLQIDEHVSCSVIEARKKLEARSRFYPISDLDTSMKSYAVQNLVHFNVYFSDHFAIRHIKRSKVARDQSEL